MSFKRYKNQTYMGKKSRDRTETLGLAYTRECQRNRRRERIQMMLIKDRVRVTQPPSRRETIIASAIILLERNNWGECSQNPSEKHEASA
jgi:predicted metal-dependent hydrolase